MTNEEAIEKIITFGSWLDESPLRDALDMAIAALRDSNEQKAEESLLTEDTDSVSKGNVIYRQAAIDEIITWTVEDRPDKEMPTDLIGRINALPSAQQERDIPVKPNETTDRAWGIPDKQAVCPKCDYYLGHIAFLGDYKGKRVTYCETCGQAIDWEGWEFDE